MDQNFAQIIANQNTEEEAEWTMLKRLVKFVELSLLKTNTQRRGYVHALALESTGEKKRVFDISVNENHEYYANGILVHNCIDAARYLLNLANYEFTPEARPVNYKTMVRRASIQTDDFLERKYGGDGYDSFDDWNSDI